MESPKVQKVSHWPSKLLGGWNKIQKYYTLVFPNIAIAGMTSPFLIGNTSTQSGAPIFQPAMSDYRSVPLEKRSCWIPCNP